MTFSVLAPARNEVIDAAQEYERQTVGLGFRFVDAVEAQYQAIRQTPRLFPLYPKSRSTLEIRFAIPERFPYVILFLLETSKTTVLAVAHERRKPNYWIDRIKGV